MSKCQTQNSAPVFFTICSKNLLGYAKTWTQSVKKHHPDSDVFVFLADRLLGPEEGLEELNIITLEEHGGSVYRDMMFKYNITEFNTSIKPFCFLYLFEKYQRGADVVYMDPDTWVYSPLVEMKELFASGADCVLTPHMTEPMGFGDLSDRSLLRYGTYNFGFVAIKNTDANEEVVCWWADELKEHCVIDFENGLFVDQKYGDLFPSFFAKAGILRHPGYNIAYWNLFSRTLLREKNNEITVNGESLRFLHFSGASMERDTAVISRHCQYHTKKNKPVYGELLEDWNNEVFNNMHDTHLEQGYSFFWNSVDKDNEHTPQTLLGQSYIAPLERSQWMYMTQFKNLSLYEKWCSNEKRFTTIIDNAIAEFKADDGKHMFCNCCFTWKLSGLWSSKAVCECGGTEENRLMNAFLYQELKLPNTVQLLATQNDMDMLSGISNPFHDLVEVSRNLFGEEQDCSQQKYGLCFGGISHLEQFETQAYRKEFIHRVIVVDGLSDDHRRDTLRRSIDSINLMDGVRASLFVGMSANHYVNSRDVGVVFLENTLSYTAVSDDMICESDQRAVDTVQAAANAA